MPSRTHETLVEIFRRRPGLVLDLLRALGVDPPAHETLRIESAELTELARVYHADLVIALFVSDAGGKAVLRIVFEVQHHRDPRKLFTWPVYAATERARSGCPVIVVVFATTTAVARWAAAPIDMGGGNVFRAVVVGPDAVPVITDPSVAMAAPELAVLSAFAHGGRHATVARTAVTALDGVPDEAAVLYLDLILAAIGPLAQQLVKEMAQNHVFQSEFLRGRFAEAVEEGREQGLEQGRLAGMVVALLAILDARGLSVSEAQRERIAGCSDPRRLEAWLRSAATAEVTSCVLDPPQSM